MGHQPHRWGLYPGDSQLGGCRARQCPAGPPEGHPGVTGPRRSPPQDPAWGRDSGRAVGCGGSQGPVATRGSPKVPCAVVRSALSPLGGLHIPLQFRAAWRRLGSPQFWSRIHQQVPRTPPVPAPQRKAPASPAAPLRCCVPPARCCAPPAPPQAEGRAGKRQATVYCKRPAVPAVPCAGSFGARRRYVKVLFTPSSGVRPPRDLLSAPADPTPLSKSSWQLPEPGSSSGPSPSVPGTPRGWRPSPAAPAWAGDPRPRGSPTRRGRRGRGAPRACPW